MCLQCTGAQRPLSPIERRLVWPYQGSDPKAFQAIAPDHHSPGARHRASVAWHPLVSGPWGSLKGPALCRSSAVISQSTEWRHQHLDSSCFWFHPPRRATCGSDTDAALNGCVVCVVCGLCVFVCWCWCVCVCVYLCVTCAYLR